MFVPTRIAVKRIEVHPNTLRKWANEGKIKHIKNPADQRLYDVDSFVKGGVEGRRVLYCRVSSKKQKDDLVGQVREMRGRYPNHEVIEDFGSGLNFKRKGFSALLDAILLGNVSEVVVAHKDRLARFGFELIEQVASKNGCRIVVLDNASLSPQEELVRDLLSIIHVFSCRLYGLRRYSRAIREEKDLSKQGKSFESKEILGAIPPLV